MYRIDNATAAAVLPAASAAGPNPNGYFTAGDAGSGTPATVVEAEWLNMLQEEISNVIEDADGGNTALSKASRTQLKEAIKAMVAANTSGQSVLFMNRVAPEWISNTTVRIPSGFKCRDKANSFDFSFGSNQDVVISGSGANGLDTGSVGPNNKYYLHAIGDSNGVNAVKGVFSLSRTAPTLPSGYNKSRPLPVVWVTDGSNNIKRMIHGGGFPDAPMWLFDEYLDPFTSSLNRVLNGGAATSLSVYDASAFVPPESRIGLGLIAQKSAMAVYKFSDSATGGGIGEQHADESRMHRILPLDSSQQGYYSTSAGNLYIAIAGYVITKEFDS